MVYRWTWPAETGDTLARLNMASNLRKQFGYLFHPLVSYVINQPFCVITTCHKPNVQ
jgi:hypothetical protein